MVTVLPFCAAVAATAGHATSEDLETIEICSDDAPETAAGFVRSTSQVLAESKLRLSFRCGPSGRVPSASFVRDEGGISVQLRSPTNEQSAHNVPWLNDTHHPIASTLALGKATTLGLFLGNLAADLQVLPLRPLPGLSTVPIRNPAPALVPAEPEEVRRVLVTPRPIEPPPAALPSARAELATIPIARTPMRDDSKDTAPAPPPAPPTGGPPPGETAPPPAAVEGPNLSATPGAPPRRSFEVSMPLLGLSWTPPSTVAPEIEMGVGWGGPRWWAVASGALELDSNFAMDGRTFTSSGFGVRLGARRTLLVGPRFRWDADATLVGHLSQYRRDGIADAQTHAWFDLGAGLHSRMSLLWGRHVSLIVVAGAQIFPTAREGVIPEGPARRINLLSLTAVGGPSFAF